jgi:hypothetical protein
VKGHIAVKKGGESMKRGIKMYGMALLGVLCTVLTMPYLITAGQAPQEMQAPKGPTYMPVVIEQDFKTIRDRDTAAKPDVMKRQMDLLNERYDLSNRPAAGVMMSGGRKAVQEGIRIKLPQGMT